MQANRTAREPLYADDTRALRVLDAIDANIAVLDSEGYIISTNKGWRSFSANNRHPDGSLPRQVTVGANYLVVCSDAVGESSENAMLVYKGIRAVIDGRKRQFSHEYPCHSSDRQRWFLMKVKALPSSSPREVVITHIDITERHRAETELFNKQRELNSALLDLQEMAERIKSLLGGSYLPASKERDLSLARPSAPDECMLETLSRREKEILSALVRGERNSKIATQLQLSPKSVSTYQSRIFEKLKVDSVAQLVRLVSSAELK
ncbi:LuxR C-terminal-related transcriptional regulator [Dechloromonas sp. HYN0024]|uniref:LuxR C-terminal-related transcriptional regulator n=1 Tax=Dechloromonas sp. HYN0024 TaxID=2231055 RepID=UPI000E44CF51|nr:LuxR C-terminal-related transcriptional regulator [Dechloromonas sp. HYN0024]AXS79086.1 hypothetical protein HYN24_02960 [Dechloromonas sp. HYN0024]